jgi:hypothetical protein
MDFSFSEQQEMSCMKKVVSRMAGWYDDCCQCLEPGCVRFSQPSEKRFLEERAQQSPAR